MKIEIEHDNLSIDLMIDGVPYRFDENVKIWVEQLDKNGNPTEKYKQVELDLLVKSLPFKNTLTNFIAAVQNELKQNEGLDITTEIKLNEVLENLNYVVGYF